MKFVKKIVIGILLAYNFSSLSATQIDPAYDLMVSGGNLGAFTSNSVVQLVNPISGEVNYINSKVPSELKPLGCNVCYFYNLSDYSYKVLFTASSFFYIYTVTENGLSDDVVVGEHAAIISTIALIQDSDVITILIGDREGKTIEYGLDGKKIRIFDGNQYGGRYGVTCFMIYQDNDQIYLASGASNGLVFIRNYATGQVVKQFQAPQNLNSLVVFKDEQGVNLIGGLTGYTMPNNPVGGIICWNVDSGELRYNVAYNSVGTKVPELGQWGFVQGLVLVDGKLITMASDTNVKIWNAQTGELEKELIYKNSEEWVQCILPFEQERVLKLVVGHTDGVIKFWNLQTGECEATRQVLNTGPENSVVFCRSIVFFTDQEKNQYCSVAGDAGVVTTFSLKNFEQISVTPQSDNTGMTRSLSTNQLPSNIAYSQLVSHSSINDGGYQVPIFDLQKLGKQSESLVNQEQPYSSWCSVV